MKVIRDLKTGAIISVQQDESSKKRIQNPLNDPLNELSDSEAEDEDVDVGDEGVKTRGIVPDLEEAAKYSQKKRPRQQSQREREWIERLVQKWGNDWGGMVRDRRLNPQQQSEGDLRRRIEVGEKKNRIGAGDGKAEN